MAGRKRRSRSPIDDFVDQLRLTGEIFLVAGLQKLLKDDCGLDIAALTAPYLDNIGHEPVNQFQSLKEQAILSKLKSEELRAANQLKLTEMKVTKEQFKLEQARKEEQPNFLVQRTETDLHSVTEFVSGTLPVAAASDAFTGSVEHEEGIQNLLDSLLNRITLILGRQGSGWEDILMLGMGSLFLFWERRRKHDYYYLTGSGSPQNCQISRTTVSF
ncbi:hypothetical protein ACFLUS_01045 [Chloroflexota bacterium]